MALLPASATGARPAIGRSSCPPSAYPLNPTARRLCHRGSGTGALDASSTSVVGHLRPTKKARREECCG